jgi:iron complex outermembrane recepter protein
VIVLNAAPQSGKRRFRRSSTPVTLSLTAIAWAVAMTGAARANADETKTDDSENIVVTAQKREQKLSDVSASVAAVSGKFVQQQQIQNLSTLSNYVPNFTYTKESDVDIITIRGLGTAGGDTLESSVGVYVDGVYLPKARDSLFPLYDLDHVEVLRGPQGALFGKNTIAGVINIETARPTDYWTGYVQASYGSYASQEETAVLSGPLSPVLSMRIAAYHRESNGYIENETPDKYDGGGYNTNAGRLTLDLHPNSQFKMTAKLELIDDQELGLSRELQYIGPKDLANPAFQGIPYGQLYHQISNQTGLFDVDNTQGPVAFLGALNASYHFDSGYTLSATAGYSHFDNRISYADALPINTIAQADPMHLGTKNIEIRLASPDDQPFRFITGFYADQSSLSYTGYSALNFLSVGNAIQSALIARGIPAALLPNAAGLATANTVVTPGNAFSEDSHSWALFGEASYRFLPAWTVVGGLRFSQDSVSMNQYFNPTDANGLALGSVASLSSVLPRPNLIVAPNTTLAQLLSKTYTSVYNTIFSPAGTPTINQSETEDSVTPSVRLEYRPLANALVYGVVQTGFKQGGYAPGTSVSTLNDFGPEKALAFELGTKTQLGPADVSAALFRTQFRDLQVSAINAEGTTDTMNAAGAVSQGIELGAHWHLNSHWSVSADYAYLDAHYTNFDNAPCSIDQLLATNSSVCSQNLSGKQLLNAPPNSFSGTVEYHTTFQPGFEFSAAFTGTYKSSYYTEVTDSSQLKADAMPLFDVRVALGRPTQHWTVALLVHNLFNRQGALMGQKPSLVADPSTYMVVPNEPRMIIGQLRYEM